MATDKRNIILVIWGAIEVVLFGGLIFGWASLVFVYKSEHIFGDLCDDALYINENISSNITDIVLNVDTTQDLQHEAVTVFENGQTAMPQHCPSQDKLFNLIYVLAVVINGVASFPNGVILDRYGIRVLRIIGMATFIPSVVMLICVTKESALLLFPAMILLAYGGYIILMTNFQLGNLIPNKKSMIISLYCGAYDSSAFVLILIKWIYTTGISFKISFFIMLGLFTIVIVSTFWYIPKNKIPWPLPPNFKMDLSCCKNHSIQSRNTRKLDIISESRETSCQDDLGKNVSQSTENSLLKERDELNNDKDNTHSFVKEAISSLFLWDMMWLTLMRLQSWSFVGRLNSVLDRLANGNQDLVSYYTSIYACLQFFGIVLAPLSGRLMDRKKNRKVDPALKRIELIEVCIASFVIDNTFGLLLAITMTIPILEVQYASFIFHVIHRALLYGPNSAFIAQAFSTENFGKLFGLAMTVSAAVSLIQFPLFVLVQGPLNGDPFWFNILILILMLIAYCHPIFLSMWCRKQRKIYNSERNKDQKDKNVKN